MNFTLDILFIPFSPFQVYVVNVVSLGYKIIPAQFHCQN